MPKIIIIYGPPGSGKGTQANKLAEKLGLVHFDTGYTIEKKVHSVELRDDPIIQRERQLFDNGILCTPEWVAEMIKEAVGKIENEGKGVVFSGSPRTLPETEEFIPFVESLYGKENIYVLKISVKAETSVFRNSYRRVCADCGLSLAYTPENEKLDKCLKCGGKLVKRILDKPEIIKVRLKEFAERTEPIYKYLVGQNYKIINIDGEPSVEEIHQEILSKIKL